MISVSLKNPPPGAGYWLPVFRDGVYGVGRGGQTYYPPYNLNLDEGWQVELDGIGKFFRVDILDPNGQMMYQYQTYFAGYVLESGKNYIYDFANNWLYPSSDQVKYYFTVARGASLAELQNDSQGKEVYGSYRLVMESRNAPSWVLSSLTWLINAARAPLRDAGVEITGAKVSGSNIIISMGGHTAALVIVAIIAGILAAAAVAIYFFQFKMQQEITAQMGVTLQTVQTTNDMANAILSNPDLSPEAKQTLVSQIYRLGLEAVKTQVLEKTGGGSIVDWTKALPWIIGGIAAIVILPRLLPSDNISPPRSRATKRVAPKVKVADQELEEAAVAMKNTWEVDW